MSPCALNVARLARYKMVQTGILVGKLCLKTGMVEVPSQVQSKAFLPCQCQMSHEKNPLTFHYTGCLIGIGILIMVHYNPHIIG